MPDLVAPQPRQRAQQQVVVLRAVVALAEAADGVDQVARVERQMIDVVDAGEQHVVERRLVEEIDGAQASVGDQFVGVEEPRRGLAAMAPAMTAKAPGLSASSWSMKPIQRPRAAAMPALRGGGDAAIDAVAQHDDAGLSLMRGEPARGLGRGRAVVAQHQFGDARRLARERGEEVVEIGGGRVVERRHQRDQRRRRRRRRRLPLGERAGEQEMLSEGVRLALEPERPARGGRREIGGGDGLAQDRRAPRREACEFRRDGGGERLAVVVRPPSGTRTRRRPPADRSEGGASRDSARGRRGSAPRAPGRSRRCRPARSRRPSRNRAAASARGRGRRAA